MPTKPIIAEGDRGSRPSDVDKRHTVLGMPVVKADSASPDAEPPRSKPGKKGRRGALVAPVEAHDEHEKMLEALDAGFDSISRPSEAEVVTITPSTVPELPAEGAPAPPSDPVVTIASDPAPASFELGPVAPMLDEAARHAQHEADMAEVRALFTQMAVAHARPLRDFMIEVTWGEPTREWFDIAVPACAALKRAAEALEMPDLLAAMDGFAAAVELCQAEAKLDKDAREMLLGAYGKLTELMPAAFALEGERGRREPIIVRSLLLQVPGVQKVALDKMYAAGLTSLEMIYAAGARELAETTGLEPALCARIAERFERYRREIAAVDPSKDRAAERAELAELAAELERAHREHERLAAAWAPEAVAGRAQARKERNDVLLKINVLLAHMGEVDRVAMLEKAPFAQKIRDLTVYLEEAKRRASRA
jgi:hypothetical protein